MPPSPQLPHLTQESNEAYEASLTNRCEALHFVDYIDNKVVAEIGHFIASLMSNLA
jgi:hypothetical protein